VRLIDGIGSLPIESALDEYEVSVNEGEPFLMFPLFLGNDPL
jgi:hypothetical protein